MWKRMKKKTIEFFFEEVEEVDISDEKSSRDKDVKMTYHYPKTKPFRFPVIPDYDVETIRRESRPVVRNQHKKHTRKRRPTYDPYMEENPLIRGYRRQKSLQEIEAIPAFMRRKDEQNDIATTRQVQQLQSTRPKKVKYSNPDELDAVFQKKNQRLKKETDTMPTYVANNHPLHGDEIKGSNAFTFVNEEVQDVPTNVTIKTDYPPINPKMNKEKVVSGINRVIEVEQSIQVPNHLLDDPVLPNDEDNDWIIEQQILLEETFEHFHIDAKVVNVTQGPSVTRFEIQPALGVRVSKIRNLADDIKLNMAAKDIRIEAPIPGKNTIGIEIPNLYPQVVGLQEIIETEAFKTNPSPLAIALGLTIEGKPLITNIEKMPHGLIAGATGSGKSVCINTILLSLLYKASYNELKFLLIDPKMVELAPYNGIPHLLSPVITDAQAAMMALKWAVKEMDERYNRLADARVRNIKSFNEKMVRENRVDEKMPYIVIVIDELADLMMVSPQEVEDAICRIAQKARACGMHLIIATQRPSVDVITGLIKANIPTRIAFSVSSQVDSRTIIDSAGAEKLLGRGDMLFVENGSSKIVRLQGPFVSDEEIDRVTNHFRSVAEPNYLFEQEQLLLDIQEEAEDELLKDAILLVLEENQASTSLLQRRFRIGYNRAARLIDSLEARGIISGQNGTKPREILVTRTQLEEFLLE